MKTSPVKKKAPGSGKVSTGFGKTPRTHTASIRHEDRWSAQVTEKSDALALDSEFFTSRIARSLKQSAEHSSRRKVTVRQSVTSMLNGYINRAGRNLSIAKQKVFVKEKKDTLKALFENSNTRSR